MSLIWHRVSRALRKGEWGVSRIGHALLRALKLPDKGVNFTIAIIALGAKLSKVDGRVSREEIEMFRRIFKVPPTEQKNVAKVFNYAAQTSTGYEHYARMVAISLGAGSEILEDVMEGLICIAVADGALSPAERRFLVRVNSLFGLSRKHLRNRLRLHTRSEGVDPYRVLGVTREQTTKEIRSVWRDKVKRHHPDVLLSRGVPKEAMQISESRLATFNRAWELIKLDRQSETV